MKFHLKNLHLQACLAALCSAYALCAAAQTPNPGSVTIQPIFYRQPMGIYARYGGGCAEHTDDCYRQEIYKLVSNPVLAGIDAELDWSDLNPEPGVYTWNDPGKVNILQDIFDGVDKWNRENSTLPAKTVQLDINPGFHSPEWLFYILDSCDAMFGSGQEGDKNYKKFHTPAPFQVNPGCGKVTFLEAEDHADPHYLPLPLPWNPTYKAAWATFIEALALQFGDNPDLVSVTVAGPTSSSSEMILPNEDNDRKDVYKWNYLIALTHQEPAYQNSDEIFIEEWEHAIDVYSHQFSGITLTITTGNGLPNYPGTDYTVPVGFGPVCTDLSLNPPRHPYGTMMDCAAETTIASYFADPANGGNNMKSIQENGMAAGGVYHGALGGGNLGSFGIRWLALISSGNDESLPIGWSHIFSRVMGGFQSGGLLTPTVTDLRDQGCNVPLKDCTTPSDAQALFNFLASAFNGTAVAPYYGPGYSGENFDVNYGPGIISEGIPINYLQFYTTDIDYYSAQFCDPVHFQCPPSIVINGAGEPIVATGQSELTVAAQQLQQIADPPVVEDPF